MKQTFDVAFVKKDFSSPRPVSRYYHYSSMVHKHPVLILLILVYHAADVAVVDHRSIAPSIPETPVMPFLCFV